MKRCRAAMAADVSSSSTERTFNSSEGLQPLLIRVRRGELDVDATSSEEALPLIWLAIRSGEWNVVTELVDRGADPHSGGDYKQSVFYSIVDKGNLALCAAIVDRGCDKTPLNLALGTAAAAGHLDMVHYLLSKGARIDAKCAIFDILRALRSGHDDVLLALLANDLDPNMPMRKVTGHLLHTACQKNRPVIVAELVKRGAKIELMNRLGLTPLHVAAQLGAVDCIDVLVQHGADLNVASDVDCYTPLHVAAQAGEVASINCLLSHGADINKVDASRRAPLLTALYRQSGRDTAETLLAWGADVHIKDAIGSSSLHYAARLHPEMLEELLSRGSHPHEADKYGETAIFSAVYHDPAVTRLLLESGASPCVYDVDGRSPMSYLVDRSDPKPEHLQTICLLLASSGLIRPAVPVKGRRSKRVILS